MFLRIKNSSVVPNASGIAHRRQYRNYSWSDSMLTPQRRVNRTLGPLLMAHRRFLHPENIRASFPMISSLNLHSLTRKNWLEVSASTLPKNFLSQHSYGSIGIKYFHGMVQRNVFKTVGFAKFSTSVAPTATTSAKSPTGDAPNPEKSKNSDGNIFLDNIGTIFLLFIASLIAWMVRGYYNGVRRNTVREKQIESLAQADPIELEDLRIANAPDFNKETFQYIRQYVLDQKLNARTPDECDPDMGNGPSDILADGSHTSSTITMVYPEFVSLVRTAMIQMKGEAFTIQLGHILDRVVVAALEKQRESRRTTEGSSDTTRDRRNASDIAQSTNLLDATPMPLEFWLTVLTLAMSGTPFERIQALHSVFRSNSDNSSDASPTMSMDQVVQLVGYLQDTCQLVPDAQVVMTSHKYPLQEYVVASPAQLVDREQWDKGDSNDGNDLSNCSNNITVNMLTEILSSRSVCAWGECYRYKAK